VRWPAALLALLVLVPAAPVAAQTALAADVRGAQVLVVGAPGLRWSDVTPETMPALHALAEGSAVGVLSVKARPAVSCPADGWLTLGAGGRAEAFGTGCGDLQVGDRGRLRERNLGTRDGADVDALARALQDAGRCLTARGPGARTAGGRPLSHPQGHNQGLGRPVRSCPALVLDAGVVGADGASRAAGAAAADALIAAVDAARDEGSTLLVVGLSQAPTDEQAHLHVALAAGPGFAPGALVSASTGREPYVQLVDVAPTVLGLLDAEAPDTVTGQPWRSQGTPPSPARLQDLSDRAVEAKRTTVAFFVMLVAVLVVALAAAAGLRSRRLAEAAGLFGVSAVGASYLAGLVPWWRADQPLTALLAVVAALGVVGALAAANAPGRTGPAGAACGGVALVLVVDLLTGSTLQIDTPAGYSPLVAGRFAGIGNVAFGVLAASVLLALAAATQRLTGRSAALVVAGGGLVAVIADGAPGLGSDVGGVLALVPALVLLGLLRAGSRVTVARLALAAAGAAVLVTAFALADAARDPADRTHLGRFVGQVADGTAGTVLVRKAAAVGHLLSANALTALLPLVVVAAVLLVLRPPSLLRELFGDAPAWRHGLLAVGVASGVGLVVNDSGPAVPALALLVAVPATAAAVARRRQPGTADR
jgi:hypothetical protein